MAKHQNEVMADFLMFDIEEIDGYRYQPTQWTRPRVYSVDFESHAYFCVGKPPKGYAGLEWEKVGLSPFKPHKEIWGAKGA